MEEAIDLTDMFYAAVKLSIEIRGKYRKYIPLHLLEDSESLFDTISKLSKKSQKLLMSDIADSKEGFQDKVIFSICFARTNHSIT